MSINSIRRSIGRRYVHRVGRSLTKATKKPNNHRKQLYYENQDGKQLTVLVFILCHYYYR